MIHETDIRCECGGRILIADMRGQVAVRLNDTCLPRDRRTFRFEAHCESCGQCDPNGWPTLRQAIEEAKKYFSAVEVRP